MLFTQSLQRRECLRNSLREIVEESSVLKRWGSNLKVSIRITPRLPEWRQPRVNYFEEAERHTYQLAGEALYHDPETAAPHSH